MTKVHINFLRTGKGVQDMSYIFILWGENFDEQFTTTVIAKLRAAGHPVKLVGLRGKLVSGIYGTTLVPDMPLSQALPLAERAAAIICPCHSPYLSLIENDPRVEEFLLRAGRHKAKFITGQVELNNLDKWFDLNDVIRCLEIDDLDQIVQSI